MNSAYAFIMPIIISLTAHANELDPASYSQQVSQKLSDPLLHQGVINEANYLKVANIAATYKKRNTTNMAWMNVFRTWNSAETLQNRTALENKRSDNLMIFEMDQGKPLDWSRVTVDKEGNPNTSESQFAMALDTTNVLNVDAPVVLILLSNQHVLNDYLSNNAVDELRKMGVIIAVMEYPGFGVSIGAANKKSWISATQQAVRFLNSVTEKKIFLLGHSIGGPLAFETAATPEVNSLVGGALSYGGFTTLKEMSKDQAGGKVLSFLAPMITRLMMRGNMIDGVSGLEKLAQNKTPVLAMHGELDGPVPVRHTLIYERKMAPLRAKYSNAILKTRVFPGLIHEEVNNFSRGIKKSEDDFYLVWSEILNFIRSVN